MSIKQHLDKNSAVNSIRLQLRHPSGADKIWIIVEGETDQKLFSKLINAPHAEIEISHEGVNGVLRSVSELLRETNRILGIRDADFLHLEGKKETAENIFLTDFHDSEMMLILCDNAYHSVAAEYLSKEKEPSLLREKIFKSLAFIGGIRWINISECSESSESLELKFEGLGFGNFYDGETLVLDEEKCLNDIMRRSPKRKKEISTADVRLKIKNISDFPNLCNGHDFQKAFALCVSFNSKKGVNDTEIGKAFRIAYRFKDFQRTELYNQLKEWSNNHSLTLFS
jgi:hypothetical protein